MSPRKSDVATAAELLEKDKIAASERLERVLGSPQLLKWRAKWKKGKDVNKVMGLMVIAQGGMNLDDFVEVAKKVLVEKANWLPDAYRMWCVERQPESSEDETGSVSGDEDAPPPPPPVIPVKPRAPSKPNAASKSKSETSSTAPTRSSKSRKQGSDAKSAKKTAAAKGKAKEKATNPPRTRSGVKTRGAAKPSTTLEIESEDDDVEEELPKPRKPARKAAEPAKAITVEVPARKRKADGSPVPSQRRKIKTPKTTSLVPSDDEVDRAEKIRQTSVGDDDDCASSDAGIDGIEDAGTAPVPATQSSPPKRKGMKKHVTVEVPAVRHGKDNAKGYQSAPEPDQQDQDEGETHEHETEETRRRALQTAPQDAILVAADPAGLVGQLPPSEWAKKYGISTTAAHRCDLCCQQSTPCFPPLADDDPRRDQPSKAKGTKNKVACLHCTLKKKTCSMDKMRLLRPGDNHHPQYDYDAVTREIVLPPGSVVETVFENSRRLQALLFWTIKLKATMERIDPLLGVLGSLIDRSAEREPYEDDHPEDIGGFPFFRSLTVKDMASVATKLQAGWPLSEVF